MVRPVGNEMLEKNREDSITILSYEPTIVISWITIIKLLWGRKGTMLPHFALFVASAWHRQKDNALPAHVKQPNVVTIPAGQSGSATLRDLNPGKGWRNMEN